ncbi:MAG: hypothetical protein PHT96_07545, partial [Syntrophorhabdaceae bacterium]|nr:hypothetical protein [Syntrophorhabdaceae bacterium]
ATGKLIEADLFVSVLGASSYLFARATPDQSTESFIDCTIRAFTGTEAAWGSSASPGSIPPNGWSRPAALYSMNANP